MEGYLDAYNPNSSVTPAGIFINRVEVRICVSIYLNNHTNATLLGKEI